MQSLLRNYIAEIVAEIQGDPRVANQLLPKVKKSKEKESEEETDEVDEMSTAGGSIAGFTGPLGASNLDMGSPPVKPGGKLKKRKKTFVRWK